MACAMSLLGSAGRSTQSGGSKASIERLIVSNRQICLSIRRPPMAISDEPRPALVASVLAVLKASYPKLSLGQRTSLAAKFCHDWKFSNVAPPADELQLHLGDEWRAAHTECHRPVPTVEAVLSALTVNVESVSHRLMIGHEVQGMTEDQRL